MSESTTRRAPRRNAKNRPNGWMALGACSKVDPKNLDVFSENTTYSNGDLALIRRVCGGCSVRTQCANYGRNERYGVWGGSTPQERGFATNGRLGPDALSA
jgi:hypothetical protein